jgi:superfamily II DNA or RNA helicase
MITDYHAKLYAHELIRRCPAGSVERFTPALMDSQVDLNPHQVDAALFAFRSPLSKGVIFADEVGLGKTIEAGIVLSQKWAERKRKILIILPAGLRKQWHQELLEKFYLPSQIHEARTFNRSIKDGKRNPFDIPDIVICSYYFARSKSEFVQAIHWDLVVIDEAHRLRNVYKTGNKIARELKDALQNIPKLLLTATPLQNSLLELYGLVSFIDEHAFGDLRSFRNQFSRITSDENFDDLKQRLQPICKRTLRRQVLEYIRFTERKAYTQEFIPSKEEEVLYDMVSDYLRRPNLQALPSSQRSLMTLVLRKLLASSTFAIAGSLDVLATKLERRLKEDEALHEVDEELEEDFEAYDELADEFETDESKPEPLTTEDRETIRNEIDDLRHFFDLAMKITQNAKGLALLSALRIGLDMARGVGGAEKAIIFTESRRTQIYLLKLLSENGYVNDIVLFNGSNNDDKSREIYANWKARCEGTDKITGSRSADIRAALVEYFQEEAKIMIATEAAAEGINLQFCSLVVNYDLPWNPQRIEQRIGRCHRYGQKYDVVVVNFLNKNNAADQRVHELLSEKFHLFSGVFGASDEVLGSIESGVDFEKRIAEIYQTCRTLEEIQASFDALQKELTVEINENMLSTRQKLLENFDAEVSEKLNVYKKEATASLNQYEALLWDIARHILNEHATFNDQALTFLLHHAPLPEIAIGSYTLKRQDDIGHHFRLQHPLAQWILSKASTKDLPGVELIFLYSESGIKISILESLIGQSGTLTACLLTVKALDTEDYVITVAITQDGYELDADQSRRLFNLPARINASGRISGNRVNLAYARRKNHVLDDISVRNTVFFDEEMDKLNRWADDRRKSLKTVLKDYDDHLAELKKQARIAPNLPEKIDIQKKIRTLDKKRDDAWRQYDEAAREIERHKDTLIDQVEARLQQEITEETLFTIGWKLI